MMLPSRSEMVAQRQCDNAKTLPEGAYALSGVEPPASRDPVGGLAFRLCVTKMNPLVRGGGRRKSSVGGCRSWLQRFIGTPPPFTHLRAGSRLRLREISHCADSDRGTDDRSCARLPIRQIASLGRGSVAFVPFCRGMDAEFYSLARLSVPGGIDAIMGWFEFRISGKTRQQCVPQRSSTIVKLAEHTCEHTRLEKGPLAGCSTLRHSGEMSFLLQCFATSIQEFWPGRDKAFFEADSGFYATNLTHPCAPPAKQPDKEGAADQAGKTMPIGMSSGRMMVRGDDIGPRSGKDGAV